MVHSCGLGMAFEVQETKSSSPSFSRTVERLGFLLAVREKRNGNC